MSTRLMGPVTDEDSAPFWQALSEHQVLLQRCLICEEVRCPPLPACMNCGSAESVNAAASGNGQIYSWIVVHRALGTIAEDEVPCAIATVELDEGCRVIGRVTGSPQLAVGLPVRCAFADHVGWTELRFDLMDAGRS